MSTLLSKADIPNGCDEWGFLRLGTIFAQENFSLRDASLSRSTSASKVSMSEARYRGSNASQAWLLIFDPTAWRFRLG